MASHVLPFILKFTIAWEHIMGRVEICIKQLEFILTYLIDFPKCATEKEAIWFLPLLEVM